MRKSILTVVLITNLALFSIIGGSGFAVSTEETSKVSEEVLAQMESMSDYEKITIYAMLEDIDHEKVNCDKPSLEISHQLTIIY